MKKYVKCPQCGKEVQIEIKDFSGIEVVLCNDFECEHLFVVSWYSEIKTEVLDMVQPETTK